MNDKCFDPGIIQAFLDGETAPELSFKVTDHAADCDECALMIAQAEEENAQVFALLDREMNTLVPTQRLWSSITVALAEEKKQHSLWDRIRSVILVAFASPSISVAAGVLVVFGLFAAVWTLKTPVQNVPEGEVATASQNPVAAPVPVNQSASATTSDSQPIEFKVTDLPDKEVGKLARTAEYRPKMERPRAERTVIRTAAAEPAEYYLPGEDSYIRTIANLKENVESRKDAVMSPSIRVAFERDMAVVNDSIKRMKEVVRKNPKNQAAKQVLYSSYQNKIELLNSIVDREELMASMQ